MGQFKEIVIEASEALEAVKSTLGELELVEGFVEEILYLAGGFLVRYAVQADTIGQYLLFAVNEGVVSEIEISEYDLAASNALHLSESIPDIIEMIAD